MRVFVPVLGVISCANGLSLVPSQKNQRDDSNIARENENVESGVSLAEVLQPLEGFDPSMASRFATDNAPFEHFPQHPNVEGRLTADMFGKAGFLPISDGFAHLQHMPWSTPALVTAVAATWTFWAAFLLSYHPQSYQSNGNKYLAFAAMTFANFAVAAFFTDSEHAVPYNILNYLKASLVILLPAFAYEVLIKPLQAHQPNPQDMDGRPDAPVVLLPPDENVQEPAVDVHDSHERDAEEPDLDAQTAFVQRVKADNGNGDEAPKRLKKS